MTKGVIPSYEACRRVVHISESLAANSKQDVWLQHLVLDSATHKRLANKANNSPRPGRWKAPESKTIFLLPLHQTLISCYTVLWLSWQKHISNAGFIGSMHLTNDSATHDIQANKADKWPSSRRSIALESKTISLLPLPPIFIHCPELRYPVAVSTETHTEHRLPSAPGPRDDCV